MWLACVFEGFVAWARRTEPRWDNEIIEPVVDGTENVGRRLQAIQGGDFRIYCLYIVAALVVLLALAVR